jgi:cell division septation protein DedD
MATEMDRGGLDLGGPHEPSYYEIALTNRQVVVAFVVLLVCLVAAFLSGMWIGRDSGVRSGQQVARLLNQPGGATPDKTDAQPQALQEFKFFNETKKRAPAEAVPAPPAKKVVEDNAEEATPQAPIPRLQHEEAPAARPVKTVPSPAVAETRSETPSPAVAKNPPVSAAAAPSSASPAANPTGDIVIQVFSTADKDQADKVRERLVKAGQPAFLSPIDKNGQTMYRVRLGPYSSRETAQAVAERVRREQKLDTWITPK